MKVLIERRPGPDIRERFCIAVQFLPTVLGLTQEPSDVERGTRYVSRVNVERLAAALAMTMADLFAAVERA